MSSFSSSAALLPSPLWTYDINVNTAIPESVYQGRIRENINATRAEIAIFALQRSESGEYEIDVVNSERQRSKNQLTVQVQCK